MKSWLLGVAILAGLAINFSCGSNHFIYPDLKDKKVYHKYEKIVLNYLKNNVTHYTEELNPKKLLVVAEFHVEEMRGTGDLNVVYQDNRNYGCLIEIPRKIVGDFGTTYVCSHFSIDPAWIEQGWKPIEFLENIFGDVYKKVHELLKGAGKFVAKASEKYPPPSTAEKQPKTHE